jgi:hypothetical protein
MRRIGTTCLILLVVLLCAARTAAAREVHGQVFFNGQPVPGATVTVTRDGKSLSTVSDDQGLYDFADLDDGAWKIQIGMVGFAPLAAQINVSASAPAGHWDLKLLDLAQLLPQAQQAKPLETRPGTSAQAVSPQAAPLQPSTPQQQTQPAGAQQSPAQPPSEESNEQAADGLLINGSQNNAATSQFNLAPAFGNQRSNSRDLYNGSIGASADNSIFDARPDSLTGEQTPKSSYNRITNVVTLGGPLRIPHLMPWGPNFFVAYQWTRNADATDQTGLVPDADERAGNLSGLTNAQGQPLAIYNPATGLPYTWTPTNSITASPQAAALLNLYPAPNMTGSSLYNYQTEVLNDTHGDALQSRLNKTLGRRDQVYGDFGFRSTRANSTNLFGFVDDTNTLGLDTSINWSHRLHRQIFALLGYHFTRMRTEVLPEFDNRENISGLAGITGNDPSPADWGPPSLQFSTSGVYPLSDANSEFNRNRTDAFSLSITDSLWHHNLTFGADYRKQEYNEYQQQNPRGTFAFTGAATQGSGAAGSSGSDFADFLLGIPDTSTLAWGNPDKYFRQPVYDVYANDDWRLLPQLTVNAGMRWDYGAPVIELKGRLVNLDITPGFTQEAAVEGSNPIGPLSGTHYPSSLVRPDKLGFEPRIGISWRPLPASTLVIRGGYGIYDDTSVYLNAAESMAQQAPLSTSLNVANSSTCKLTLANGFPTNCTGTTADNFAVDPNMRVGYAQVWQLSAQTDLPWSLVTTVTYSGSKGTHGMQEFLPNTYPIGAVTPCPSCPEGFVYRTSGGNSLRQAGQFQLRRRLRSGFAATVEYTFSKSLDDDAQVGALGHVAVTTAEQLGVGSASSGGSALIAQNWLNPRAERSLSSFDQRQLLTAQVQYTTGMGLGGRTLMSGWHGRLLKEWTVMSQISAGSGTPETPVYFATVPGTGITNTIRPDLTGTPIYQSSGGAHLNVNAYTAPASGAWGTAGRNSITGPGQFSLNGSMARTFRLRAPYNLDVRVDATNLLNHGTFSAWNSTVNSTTFGLPAAANAMRSLQITGRLRF